MIQAPIARAFERGLAHHRAGRLAEAESVYRQILESAPGHPDALHLLGVIAHQAGRDDAALELVDGALQVNPAHPGYRQQRGRVLGALGRLDEATASFRAALASSPDYVEAHAGLGNVLKLQGRLAESIDCYRRALALRPDFAEAHANLGNALYVLGHGDAALASYARALQWVDTPDIRSAFAQCLRGATFDGAEAPPAGAPDIHILALRALDEPWARPADLAAAGIRLVLRDPAIAECVARASRAWPDRLPGPALFGTAGFAAVAGDRLLRTLLESAPACDLAMERFLTMARHAMLEIAEAGATQAGAASAEGSLAAAPHDGHGARSDAMAFRCALARQCHINDYVYATTDAEARSAARLRDDLVAAIGQGGGVSAATLALVGSYFPLATLPGIETLLARSWPGPVAALLAQQVAEPLEERSLRATLPRLTAIDDAISQRVRQQYEEHPYPRWIKSPPADPEPGMGAHLRRLFPLAALHPIDDRRDLDILVAGCGTGQESIETARQFPQARVLAVDLSLASLAYAERKARELGLRNLEHAQADILGLGAIGRSFDVVAATGVLHHLADPLVGWRTLCSLLRPGGFMRIGLYSDKAREVVAAARRFIAAQGYAPTPDGIRRCRQALMAAAGSGEGSFAELALLRDFYGTCECRDLLFHAQEQRYTLSRLRGMLASLDLRFLGFLLAPGVARGYAERHPDDPAMTDLDAWNDFEAEFPHAFAGMYVFWAQSAA